MPDSDTKCHLLELPAELRLNIYDLLLPNTIGVEYRKSYGGWTYALSRKHDATALIRTCRTIQDEISTHIFSSVRFVFGTVTKDLVNDLKSNNLDAIHSSFTGKSVKNVEINVSKYICDLPFEDPPISLAKFLEAFMPMFDWGRPLTSLKFKTCFGDWSYDPRLLQPLLTVWQRFEISHPMGIEAYKCLPLPKEQPADFLRQLQGKPCALGSRITSLM